MRILEINYGNCIVKAVIEGETNKYTASYDSLNNHSWCTCPRYVYKRETCKHQLHLLDNLDFDKMTPKGEFNNFLCGCNTIDHLLEDGFPQGSTVAIFAESGRGKTLLSAQLALSCIEQLKQNVLVLETEGNRKQDYYSLIRKFNENRYKLDMKDVVSNLKFKQIISKYGDTTKSMSDLLQLVGYRTEIEQSKKGDKYSITFRDCTPRLKEAELKSTGLLIVDSLTEPLKATIGHKSQNLPARSELISRFFSRLISIAVDYEICVIINHHACHDKDTKVLVKDKGIIKYTDVLIGDKVLGLDKNGKSIWTKVKNKYIYPYDGLMIRFKGKSIDLCMTPNHRFLQINGRYKGKRYSDVSKYRDAESIPKGAFGIKSSYRFNDKFMEEDELILLMKNYPLEFLEGWYISEGYLDKEDLPGSRFGCRFCVNKDDLKWLEPTLKKCNIPYWKSKEIQNEIQVGISRKNIYTRFSKFGRDSYNKHIPTDIIQEYNDDQLKALLFGYLLGDGHKSYKQSNMFTTVSEKLVSSLIELCSKIGYSVTYNTDISNNKSLSRVKNPKDVKRYYGHIKPKPLAYGYKSLERYHGNVWCLETETGNFMVIRNGKPSFSGNSINPLQLFGRDFGKPYGGDEVLYNSKYILAIIDSDMAARAKYGDTARRVMLMKHPFNAVTGKLFPVNLKQDYGFTDEE